MLWGVSFLALFGVLCASYVCMGVSFLNLGEVCFCDLVEDLGFFYLSYAYN